VYTHDWRDTEDVLDVGQRLKAIDAVRSQAIRYKPDLLTQANYYVQTGHEGETALYLLRPPYAHLEVNEAVHGLLTAHSVKGSPI